MGSDMARTSRMERNGRLRKDSNNREEARQRDKSRDGHETDFFDRPSSHDSNANWENTQTEAQRGAGGRNCTQRGPGELMRLRATGRANPHLARTIRMRGLQAAGSSRLLKLGKERPELRGAS